eukprot:10328658-Lingulodinium_polyedra.AAC.1
MTPLFRSGGPRQPSTRTPRFRQRHSGKLRPKPPPPTLFAGLAPLPRAAGPPPAAAAGRPSVSAFDLQALVLAPAAAGPAQ